MSAAVFAKLAVLVLATGGSAVGMLALRQSRLQAAHEAAEARLRMRTHAERTMDLRAEVARRVNPEALAGFADDPELVPAIEARHEAETGLAHDPEFGPGPSRRSTRP
ncbi:MAG: hypothetical protein LAT64_01415 [Phycisphaerales bacterium]|nr:hypothetical protein [Planctomycetota bacterium]MCH8507420.1 hypothetical protein [Phycisphaerales bacterium]